MNNFISFVGMSVVTMLEGFPEGCISGLTGVVQDQEPCRPTMSCILHHNSHCLVLA